jgi:hypothetical protein
MDGDTDLYKTLATPLRMEYGTGHHQLLLDSLVEGLGANEGWSEYMINYHVG